MTAKPVQTIKDCPFCGDYPPAPRMHKRTAKHTANGWHYMVRHGWCGSEGAHGLTENQAIEKWNKRASDTALFQVRELLEAKAKEWGNWADMHLDGEALTVANKCHFDLLALASTLSDDAGEAI